MLTMGKSIANGTQERLVNEEDSHSIIQFYCISNKANGKRELCCEHIIAIHKWQYFDYKFFK